MKLSYSLMCGTIAAAMAAAANATGPSNHLPEAPASATMLSTAPRNPTINWGKPVFADNFNGRHLNLRHWNIYDRPKASGVNQPRRTKSSVKVLNGSLELIGHYQKPYGYVSGGVSNKPNRTYGRWVVRFRADAGAGYRPVVLLWPHGKFPDDGEIDMAEIFKANRLGGGEFLHLGADNHFIGHPLPRSANFTRWHTIAVDWLPDHITFWLDGRKIWSVKRGTGRNYIPSTPFHLALQNDQGCDDGCKPNKNTPKNVIMQVDWIKIYAVPSAKPLRQLRDQYSDSLREASCFPRRSGILAIENTGNFCLPTSPDHGTPATVATKKTTFGIRPRRARPERQST
jgi:beta-glucanase (GH16 family)